VAALNRADVENAVKTIAKQAGDSRLNIAAEGRTFLRWCHKNHHHRQDLSVHLKVVAGRKHGEESKPQLRKDEARRWLKVAEAKAAGGDVGALAAMLTLLLGMRVSEIVNRTVRDLDDDGRELVIERSKTRAGTRRLQVPETLRPHLLRLAEGRAGGEKLFEGLTRHHVNEHVQRLCELAEVPTVCAHAMRGLHASLAVAAGATGTVVAASLGHESFRITTRSYATPDSVASARQAIVAEELADGGRSSKSSNNLPS
jgi:integrase